MSEPLLIGKEKVWRELEIRKDKIRQLHIGKTDFGHLTSRVAVVLDTSGSMRKSFENGDVQSTLERLLPLAMAFDDDGSMELWTFNHGFKRCKSITRDNIYGYVDENIRDISGGTNYAPVIYDICDYYITEVPEKIPNYIIFITDGDNDDKYLTDKAIKAASHFPIFFQFVGLSEWYNRFDYLQKLDDMPGRYIDNANFFKVKSLTEEDCDDNEIYKKLLAEYPEWLNNAKVKAMIDEADDVKSNKKKWKKVGKHKRVKPDKNGSSADVGGALEVVGDVLEIVSNILEIFAK